MIIDKSRDSVGVIGLGIMGGAFARNMLRDGWRVAGTDIDQTRCAELARDGVTICPSATAVAQACPVVLTSLPTPQALATVAAELVSADLPARVFVELSTFTLDDKQAYERTLAAKGHTVLDCPVSGTGAQAAGRDLIIYASGDAGVIDGLAELFASFSRGLYSVGGYGNGSRMKYVANHLVAIHNVASAEALLLAEKAGLDLDIVLDCIGNGAGTSRMFEMRGPMMAADSYKPASMKMVNWMKDMSVIGAYARQLGSPTPLFDATVPIYEKAMAQGRREEDTASVFGVMAGRPVKPS